MKVALNDSRSSSPGASGRWRRIARERNLKRLYLTVNKHNDHSIAVYRKKGFLVIKEQAMDIGNGFVMDDYVMEKGLPKDKQSAS